MNIKNKAFTLVELIVVITLIAVLASISIIYFNWHLSWVRDWNRLAQLNSISDWAALKIADWKLLKPESPLEIYYGSWLFSYQWIFWDNLLEEIEYSMTWLDPLDKDYFTYVLSSNSKYFQIMSFMENENALRNIWYAGEVIISDDERIPYVVWSKEIGIFLDDQVIPINEYENSPFVIQDTDTQNYNVILKNDKIVSSAWKDLFDNINLIVDNYGDNVYGCADKSYKYATYTVGQPNISNTPWQNSDNTRACYFECNTGYNFTWLYCEPNITRLENVACVDLPTNATENTATEITQNWDNLIWDYIPSNIYVYDVNPSSDTCVFDCNINYNYNYSANTCDPVTRNATCEWLPTSNAIWWESDSINKEIIQFWDGNVNDFTPFTWWIVSSEIIENECSFRCIDWYSYTSWTNSCDPATRVENCTWLPVNAFWNPDSTVTQTYNPSITAWEPSNIWTETSDTSSSVCKFSCNSNYTWDWYNCNANTQVVACDTATLPSNTQWNWWTGNITQTWNWSTWWPSNTPIYNETSNSNSCNFICQSWYLWNWTSCNQIDNFKNTLVDKCWISSSTFDSSFDSSTGIYNWTIDCTWDWVNDLNDTDISYFNVLTWLTWDLILFNNNISDITWLRNIETLNGTLSLSNNTITDLSPLNKLTDLVNLQIANNGFTNLSSIDSKIKSSIDTLIISWNNLWTINWITDFTNLVSLNINSNNISDISLLSSMLWMKRIYLSNNNVSDFEPLYPLRDTLERIFVDNNPVTDLSALDRISYTWPNKYLRIDDVALTRKISPLSKVCTDWIIVDAWNNSISDKSNICYTSVWELADFWTSTNMFDWLWSWNYVTNLDNNYENKNGSYAWWFKTNWTTPSSNTWPWSAYDSYYLFIEASTNNRWYSYKHSALSYDITDSVNNIDFYYHAYGSNIWILYVVSYWDYDWDGNPDMDVQTVFSRPDNIWQTNPSSWSAWIHSWDIRLPRKTNTVLIYYVTWAWYTSDFSIDNLNLSDKW